MNNVGNYGNPINITNFLNKNKPCNTGNISKRNGQWYLYYVSEVGNISDDNKSIFRNMDYLCNNNNYVNTSNISYVKY